jgi:hypothetical protein
MTNLFIFPLAITLALQSITATVILKKDNGKSGLQCHRYFLASFIEIDSKAEFHPFASTRAIRDICKSIKDSCCSLEEMVEFQTIYRAKKEVIKNVQASTRYLYKIIEKITPSEIYQRCVESEECTSQLEVVSDFESAYVEVVGRKDIIFKRIDEFLDFVIKYYSGMVCTACDLQLNQFFYTKATEEGEELGYVYKIDNCVDIYQKIKSLLPAISDLMFLNNVVKIYQITGAEYLQGLDFNLDDFTNLSNFTKDFAECTTISKEELLKSKYCKDICKDSFALMSFADPQRIFEILEKTLYAFERILIESVTDDPEVLSNSVKILKFSDDMELQTHDRQEDAFQASAASFPVFYQQAESAPYELSEAFIHFDTDGIDPYLVAMNSGLLSSFIAGLLLLLLVK